MRTHSSDMLQLTRNTGYRIQGVWQRRRGYRVSGRGEEAITGKLCAGPEVWPAARTRCSPSSWPGHRYTIDMMVSPVELQTNLREY